MKLGKFLAEADVASRRGGKELISAGRVRVNGQIAASAGIQINPEEDAIEVDGRRILGPRLHGELNVEKVYILLNKPPGYLSTTDDPQNRKTVMDLLPHTDLEPRRMDPYTPTFRRLYPVGRLDMDAEGLLIITNDGDLTYRLTHPKHHVDKVYLVWVEGNPTDESLDRLRRGIMLEDGMTAPALVERAALGLRPSTPTVSPLPVGCQSPPDCYCQGQPAAGSTSCLKMTIHEGRKRQIKRMCRAVGHRVQRLKRIQLGPIHLGELRPGDYRHLSKEEVEALKREAERVMK